MKCLKIVVRKQDGDSDLHVFGKHGSRRAQIQGLESWMEMRSCVDVVQEFTHGVAVVIPFVARDVVNVVVGVHVVMREMQTLHLTYFAQTLAVFLVVGVLYQEIDRITFRRFTGGILRIPSTFVSGTS